MIRFLSRFFPLIVLFTTVSASAGIAVVPTILIFAPNQLKHDFTVSNADTAKIAYVAIQVERVENFGTPQEKAVPIDNPQKSGILVSPTKLALPPGGSRLVRVNLTQPLGEQEQRYLLHVTPKEGELIMANSPSDNTIRTGLHVIIAYDVQVLVPPMRPNTKLSLTRNGQQITARNQGNTIISLFNGKQCSTLENCQKISGLHKLAPGSETTFTVPNAMPVMFSQSALGQITPVQSN